MKSVPHARKPHNLRNSQNFLRSPQLVASLVGMSSIGAHDHVVEIGPGKGIVTLELAKIAARVTAIELDLDLFIRLKAKFASLNNVRFVHKNFLEFELPRQPYKVFAAVPYDQTTAILRKLVDAPVPPADSFFIVQKEAAVRFAGNPYGRETLPSLLLKPYFELSVLHNLRRTDFDPVPRVDSVLLRMKRRDTPAIPAEQFALYRDFLSFAFSRGAPTLRERIKKVFTKTQFLRLANDLGFDPSVTPSQVSYEQWRGLFGFFQVICAIVERKRNLVSGAGDRLAAQQAAMPKIYRSRPD